MNGMTQSPVPFGGEAWTTVGRDRNYLSDGSPMVVDAYDPDGTQILSIRVQAEEPSVTTEDVTRSIEASLAHPIYELRPDAGERARMRYLRAPVPPKMRAHAETLVDAEDRCGFADTPCP